MAQHKSPAIPSRARPGHGGRADALPGAARPARYQNAQAPCTNHSDAARQDWTRWDSIRDQLERVFNEYGAARDEALGGYPLANFIHNDLAGAFYDAVAGEFPEMRWVGSPGKGNWASGHHGSLRSTRCCITCVREPQRVDGQLPISSTRPWRWRARPRNP
jgi:hypothetical protein